MFLTGAVVLVVAVAAAGGFATAEVPETEVPRLSAGTKHVNDRFAVTVLDARIGDEIDDAAAYPSDDERVLAITVEVENLSDEAFSSTSAFNNTIVVRDLDENQESSRRSDDGTRAAWLQPGVPVTLVLSWCVPVDFLADGDMVQIDLLDPQKYTLSTLGVGTTWSKVTPGASVELTVEDVDVDSDSEGGE